MIVPEKVDGPGRHGRVGVEDAGENVTESRPAVHDQVGLGIPPGATLISPPATVAWATADPTLTS